MTKPVTVLDVVKHSGVSKSTVSLVLPNELLIRNSCGCGGQ
jgi:DNA-binding LacI/PurR family transcriptional regulator